MTKNFDDFKKIYLSNYSLEISELAAQQASKSMSNIKTKDINDIIAQASVAAVSASTVTLLATLEKYHEWLNSETHE